MLKLARVARAGISGVVVGDVGRGTPAAAAGLKSLNRRTGELGDVIVAINGKRVETLATFVAELDRVGIGNCAEFTLMSGQSEPKVRMAVIDVVR